MPVYEYRCNSCKRRVSHFVRSFSAAVSPRCDRCGSEDLTRLVSTFALVRSEDARLEEMADPSRFGDVDENDPRSLARWARRFGKEMGEDMGPEFDEMVDRMEAGQMPDDWDGGDAGGGLDMGDDF